LATFLKQNKIHNNNVKESKKRNPHQYKVGDKILYQIQTKGKFANNPYKGLYIMTQVNNMEQHKFKLGQFMKQLT